MREIGASWQQLLTTGFDSAKQILEYLNLTDSGGLSLDSQLAHQQFTTKVPKRFVDKMTLGDREDPLLLQVLPQGIEMQKVAGYTDDPLIESEVNPLPGLLHKYHGRVLLTLSNVCAINCRYCFRRHFPYRENLLGSKTWPAVLAYLSQNDSISEVILSGGDPMLVNDKQLGKFVEQLEKISHITTLRIHSRLPIVLPERFNDDWLACFNESRLNKVMVLHCNHANELDDDIANLCQRLKQAHFHLLNQTVLLKGVNDSVEVLTTLSQSLFNIGVLPYYLHQLDKVKGAHHFEIQYTQALELHQAMKASLPGYLVPKLVRETPFDKNKTWLFGV